MKMNADTIYDVVGALIGPIAPQGDSAVDDKRFKNLKTLCGLVDRLLTDISKEALTSQAHQASIRKSEDFAADFLKEIEDSLGE